MFVVNCTGGGLVVKRPGVLSEVLKLDLVLRVGVFSPLPTLATPLGTCLLRQTNITDSKN